MKTINKPPPKKILRRYVVLLELIIAMSLTMVLLTIVLGIYDHINKLNVEADKKQNETFHQLYLSSRLASILPKAVGSDGDPTSKDYIFYSAPSGDRFSLAGSSSLIFMFDNGVSLVPEFANHALGKLYVDKERNLSLALWPSYLRWDSVTMPPIYHEVLYRDVEKLSISYYTPPLRKRKEIWQSSRKKLTPPGENFPMDDQGGWRDEWLQEYYVLPSLIKLTITPSKGKAPIVLEYPLPNSELFIMYGPST